MGDAMNQVSTVLQSLLYHPEAPRHDEEIDAAIHADLVAAFMPIAERDGMGPALNAMLIVGMMVARRIDGGKSLEDRILGCGNQ